MNRSNSTPNNDLQSDTQSAEAQATEDKKMPEQTPSQPAPDSRIAPKTEPQTEPQTVPQISPPTKPQKTKQPRVKVPIWRFLIAMLIQSALIVAVPFKSAITYANGQTVTLQTLPVDPYDLLRGYSQTLRFEISEIERLKELPGADSVFPNSTNQYSFSRNYNDATPLYVTLEAPTDNRTEGQIPTAWQPVAVSQNYPEDLAANQIALQGYAQGRRIIYGLETYYMPEAQRTDINDKIRAEQQTEEGTFVVDIKVDRDGNSVPSSLWIRDQEFKF